MTLLRGLYLRFRQLIHEGAKFGAVGLTGVVIVLVGADLLRYDAGLGKYTSITIATVAATAATFVGNRYWTFRSRQRRGTGRETVMFFALNAVGLLIQYACIGLVQDALHLPGTFWYTSANLMGIGLGTIFRFWSYRRWVWQAPKALEPALQPALDPEPAMEPGWPVSPALAPAWEPRTAQSRHLVAVPALPREHGRTAAPRWNGPKHARRSGSPATLADARGEPR